nr:M20 family metallopeptidase [Sedimentibacter sp.]
MEIKLLVDRLNDEIINIRRDLHMNPEIGNNEFRTMKKICEYLDLWNIEYESGVAETGVVAIIKGKNNGRTIGVRADIDALPITEDSNESWKSRNDGIMHACGHDAHTAIALGTAKILKSMESELNGNVKFFFQPAEETTGGAERMIKEGCLKNPDVDYVVGLHVEPGIDTGKVGIKYGKMMASSDEIKIIVNGKSSHGAYPHEGVDPIFIASNLVLSLQSIVSRNISPLNSAVFTVGSIHGGTAGNVISDEVTMTGILRTLDPDTRLYMKDRITSIVENVSIGLGGKSKLIIRESYGALINDDETVDEVRKTMVNALGEENVLINEFPTMGTEDFSYFSQSVKSCFYNLGCSDKDKRETYPLHSSKFNLDEGCLKIGVELQVKNVLALLNK